MKKTITMFLFAIFSQTFIMCDKDSKPVIVTKIADEEKEDEGRFRKSMFYYCLQMRAMVGEPCFYGDTLKSSNGVHIGLSTPYDDLCLISIYESNFGGHEREFLLKLKISKNLLTEMNDSISMKGCQMPKFSNNEKDVFFSIERMVRTYPKGTTAYADNFLDSIWSQFVLQMEAEDFFNRPLFASEQSPNFYNLFFVELKHEGKHNAVSHLGGTKRTIKIRQIIKDFLLEVETMIPDIKYVLQFFAEEFRK